MIPDSKHITVLVSNDLEFDQRVSKVCSSLMEQGYELTLVGVRNKKSNALQRPYKVKRLSLPFSKGPFFYIALNIRLLFFLLFERTDCILSNDLDTLLPGYLVSRWRRKTLVYDSHEYFTGAEGLTGRPFVRGIWESIERFIFPKLKFVYTVNQSIADIYSSKYNVNVGVVRNVPLLSNSPKITHRPNKNSVKKIILQGAYLDPDRGGKEAVDAMQYIKNAELLIVGSGREMAIIKEKASKLKDKVVVKDKMPFNELRALTAQSDLGLSLDKPIHENYRLSLPNKLFDYIHCGVPVLVSDLPELKRIVEIYQVGWILDEVTPTAIAKKIEEVFNDERYDEFAQNCLNARQALCWEKESEFLKELFRKAFLKDT